MEPLELLELRKKQVSTCPQTQNLIYPRSVEQQISQSVGDKIRSYVERRQQRFRRVISNKHLLSLHQGSRKRSRLRLRDHMMLGRSRETLDCLFNLAEKTFLRKFRMLEELAWKR